MRKGIGGHHSAKSLTDIYLTPPEIIKSLGEFDLDPCAPVVRPWDTAKHHFCIHDDGLSRDWFGRVWCNPPYGRETAQWLERISTHGNGIALIFARTETDMYFRYVWERADSVFFFRGRLHFHTMAGDRLKANAGAPNCLIAYGEQNVDAISDSGIDGKHVLINAAPIIIVGVSPSWKSVVSIAIGRLNNEAALNDIYELVERIAPDKVEGNQNYKAKIRQKLQTYFNRVSKGVYSNS